MKKQIIFVAFFCAVSILAADISGKVLKVFDGDTVKIEDCDGGKYKVRFADIDAPEKTQLCGKEAKEYLTNLLLNKVVNVHFTSIDMYGRIVGTVYLEDGVSVNMLLVKNGLAWWYREYSTNQEYANLESEARKKKVGIWKEKSPIPPWQYRKSIK